jgi:hypothetical protein
VSSVPVAAVDYGPFTNLVADVGTLFAAIGVIALTWRGRARWEPSEEDVATGAQKVGGVLAVVGLVLLWTAYHGARDVGALPWLLVAFGALTLAGLLVYSFLIARQTYELEQLKGAAVQKVTVIGGFRTTVRATELERQGKTVQDILKGAAYEVDRVWPRGSRAMAKLSFVAAYLLLTVSGTLAVAAAALLLGIGS